MKKLIIIPLLFISLWLNAATYYVATAAGGGNDANAGTIGAPWLTWQKAFDIAEAGDIVYFRGGTYPTSVIDGTGVKLTPSSGHGHNGTAESPIVFMNYEDEIPILDCFESTAVSAYNYGIYVYNADYITFKGLQITRVLQKTEEKLCVVFHTNYSDHIRVENCVASYSGGQLFNFYNSKYLEVINCDAHDGCDTLHAALPGGWSSGFGSPNYEFEDGYMYFYGCRAWNCSDQGFAAGGPASLTVYENCWSFNNGDEAFPGGDGHGWKIGYWDFESATEPVVIMTNCIAAENKRDGFAGNEHDYDYVGVYHLFNNLAYGNGRAGFLMYATNSSDAQELKRALRNNASYNNSVGNFGVAGALYTHSNNTWDASPAVTVSAADFISLDVTQLDDARQADGSLPVITFGHLAVGSDLIGAGVGVGITLDGDGNLVNDPPDLGPFAYNVEPPVGGDPATVITADATSVKSILATSGGDVTEDGGAAVTDRGVCWSTSANPTISGSHLHTTGTTGSYSLDITGLLSNTTYHIRSFATNSVGTAYGAEITFTTDVQSVGTTNGSFGLTNGSFGIVK